MSAFKIFLLLLCSQSLAVGFMNQPSVQFGSYTPTGTGTANVSSISCGSAIFSRVGTTVQLSGVCTVGSTLPGIQTQFTVSFPSGSSSTFTSTSDASGTAVSIGGTSYRSGLIYADTSASLPRVELYPVNTSNNNIQYTLQYLIK